MGEPVPVALDGLDPLSSPVDVDPDAPPVPRVPEVPAEPSVEGLSDSLSDEPTVPLLLLVEPELLDDEPAVFIALFS